MKTKVNNEVDVYSLGIIAGLQNPRSLAAVLGNFALRMCPKEENAEFVIAKTLIPSSFQYNASAYGYQLMRSAGKNGEFEDSKGFQTPDNPKTITVMLLRKKRTATERWKRASPSVTSVIKQWLELNAPKSSRIRIMHEDIPPFIFSHPEQLSYRIKQETLVPIKIKKLKRSWLISRK